MEFLLDYAGFLAKTVTVVIAIVAVLITIAALRRSRGKPSVGHLQVEKLNDFYKGLRERLEHSIRICVRAGVRFKHANRLSSSAHGVTWIHTGTLRTHRR